MNPELRSLSEISRQATEILVREMGVVDAMRFLGQFTGGRGDYTQERGQWLGDLSLQQITSEIKARRSPRG